MELRVSFSIFNSAKLLWIIDACRYVKINFSLPNDVWQDAIEINGRITQRNAKCYAVE